MYPTPPALPPLDLPPSDNTPGARLVAIETRQKLRDEHVDRRFDAMNAEFSSLDKRVSSQIAGLDHKIEMGFRMLSEELKTDRNTAETRVAKMYDDWKGDKDQESQRPASVKVSLLLGLAGVMFPTLSIGGILVMLVVSPVSQKLVEHVESGAHGDGEKKIALLEERTSQQTAASERHLQRADEDSRRRHDEQAAELALHTRALEKLQDQRVADAESRGRMQERDDWLRSGVAEQHEGLRRHMEQSEQVRGNNAAEIARIQGTLGELNRRIDIMDSEGYDSKKSAD